MSAFKKESRSLVQQQLLVSDKHGLAKRGWYERIKGIVLRSPDSATRSYRYMSRLLERELKGHERGVNLVFSSPDDEAVTSDAVLMLGFCLQSELGCRVLIIDTTLKRGVDSISKRFGIEESTGYAEMLAADKKSLSETVQSSGRVGVDLLARGCLDTLGLAALERESIRAFLDMVASAYDYILIQQGGALTDTRYLLVNALADVVFLVAEENKTMMNAIDDDQRLLADNGVENVRILLKAPA